MSLKTRFLYATRESGFVFIYLLVVVMSDASRLLKEFSWSFFAKEFLPKFLALLDTLKLSPFFFFKKSNKEKIESLAIRADEEKIIYETNLLNRQESLILEELMHIYTQIINKLNSIIPKNNILN